MKRFKFLSAFLLLSIFVYWSCTNEPEAGEQKSDEFAVSKIENYFAGLDRKNSQVTFLEGEGLKSGYIFHNGAHLRNKSTVDNVNGVYFTQTEEDKPNFNDLLDDPNGGLELLSVVRYLDPSSGLTEGITNYLYSISDKKMYVNTYNVVNNNHTLISGYPKIVNDVLFDDIMHVQNTLFSGNDVDVITSNYERDLDFDYNDLYLEHMTTTFENNNWIMSVEYPNDPTLTEPSFGNGDKPCSAAVMACTRGNGPRCTMHGCREDCLKDLLTGKYSAANLISEYNTFELNLPNNLLYSLRDDIKNTEIGSQLSALYYIVGGHFRSTVNTQMLIDIAAISPDVSDAIDNYILQRNDRPVISLQLATDIKSILAQSKNNSGNERYKKTIQMVSDKLDECTDKTYNQLKSVLNK